MPASLRRLAPLAALVVAALTIAPAAALADCPGAGADPTTAQAPTATLCLINAQRTLRGLPPLTGDARLRTAATAFAQDMVARGFFDHTSPGGGTLLQRLRAAGWLPASGGWTAGENIAWGSGELGTPARIVDAWMASPGHRANILRPAFDEVGLGIAPGAPQAGVAGVAATYVTDFGARDAGPARSSTSPARRAGSRCAHAARRTKRPRGCSARR